MYPGQWAAQREVEAVAADVVAAFEDGPAGRWWGRGWNRLVRRRLRREWPELYDALWDLSEAMDAAGSHPYR